MNRSRSSGLRAAALIVMGCGVQSAGAAIVCNLSAPSMEIVYSLGSITNTTGVVNLNCTRSTSDPNSVQYWIGLDNGDTGTRRLFRHGGGSGAADRMNYTINKDSGIFSWTNSGTGRVSGTQSFGGATSFSVPLSFTWGISLQFSKAAGIYDSLVTASLQLSSNGAVVDTTSFYLTASVPTQCFVGQVGSGNTAPGAVSPSPLTLNYTSFAAAAQTATMGFTVNCTMGTAYSLALSPASGTLLGLNYSLALDSTSAVGTGLAQQFSVTGSIPANQSGICATSASLCSASRATTITITY